MTEREFDAISRLSAWVRDFGYQHTDVFNADIESVLNMARKYGVMTEAILTASSRPTFTAANIAGCECHERDSSFLCEYCRSQGYRGHMEAEQSSCSCDMSSGRIDHACEYCKSRGHLGAMDWTVMQ